MITKTATIPCVFKVNGIPANGKHRKTEFQYEPIELTFKMVDSVDEAPVAIHYHDTRIQPPYSSVSNEIQLRWFENSLYEPITGDTYGEGKVHCSLEFLHEFLEKGNKLVRHSHLVRQILDISDEKLMRAMDRDDPDRYRPFTEKQWKTFEGKDRADAHAEIQTRASDLLIIDGHFWKKCCEPVYELTTYHYEMQKSVSLCINPYRGAPELHRGRIFRLDAWDLAIEAAAERSFFPVDESRASIFISEAIRCDPLRSILIARLSTVIEDESKRLKDIDIPGFIAYAKLRDDFRDSVKDKESTNTIAEIAATYMRSGYGSAATLETLSKALAEFDAEADISVSAVPSANPVRR